MTHWLQIMQGDCVEQMRTLGEASVQCCVTSPPYWGLRDYGVVGQIGLEPTPEAYVARLVEVFREVWRVLKEDGTLWVNLGDSYAMTTKGSSGKGEKQITNGGTLLEDRKWAVPTGLKQKDLVGIPWRVAFALQADGWYLRSDIIWSKPNPMPESVTDRPTKAHEYIFLLTKASKYFYDSDSIREDFKTPERLGERSSYAPGSASSFRMEGGHETKGGSFVGLPLNALGRNKRSVWEVCSCPYSGAHFATFPPKLIEPCILAGSRAGDTILDPFGGSGTTGQVALEHGRKAILCELNADYVKLIEQRCDVTRGMGW